MLATGSPSSQLGAVPRSGLSSSRTFGAVIHDRQQGDYAGKDPADLSRRDAVIHSSPLQLAPGPISNDSTCRPTRQIFRVIKEIWAMRVGWLMATLGALWAEPAQAVPRSLIGGSPYCRGELPTACSD